MFQSLDSTLDPAMARRNFIRDELFEKCTELKEQAQGAKYWTLVELGQLGLVLSSLYSRRQLAPERKRYWHLAFSRL